MTSEDLRALAVSLVEKLAERPAEGSIIVALVLSELLAVGLFGGDRDEATEFASAVNSRLAEIALRHGADRGWRLELTETPKRH